MTHELKHSLSEPVHVVFQTYVHLSQWIKSKSQGTRVHIEKSPLTSPAPQ